MTEKNLARRKNDIPLTERYLSTWDVAKILNTSPTSIKEARCSGMLFGRPAPDYRKIGLRKIVYEAQIIIDWVESAPLQRVVGSACNR